MSETEGYRVLVRWRVLLGVGATVVGLFGLVAWAVGPHRSYLGGSDFEPYRHAETWASIVAGAASAVMAVACVVVTFRLIGIEERSDGLDRRTRLVSLVVPLLVAVLACGVQWEIWQDTQRAIGAR